MWALHILIMNSETIWVSHSGLARQELQGSPVHDQLIGKPGFITGPRFHTVFINKGTCCTQTDPLQSGNVLNDIVDLFLHFIVLVQTKHLVHTKIRKEEFTKNKK